MKLNKQIIELDNGSSIRAVSASDQANIEGLTFNLIILDEAQKISNYTFSERILPMGGACQLGSTNIQLANGEIKTIEEIVKNQINEPIASYDEKTKTIVNGNIVRFLDMGLKPVMKITLESGNSLTLTKDHRLITWIRNDYPRHPEWILAKDIKVGTRIGVPRITPFFGNINEPNAYLLGLLIGDGSYGLNTSVHFGSYSNNLWNYVSKFSNNIKYYQQFKTTTGKDYRAARIKELIPIVKNAGIYGQTSINKTLPIKVMQYNEESIKQLLAGLFDSDGNVFFAEGKKPSISFSNICKPIIDTMQQLLLKLGIRAHIQYRKANPHTWKDKEIKSKKDYYVLHIFGKENIETFYEKIPIIEEYKRDNLDKMYVYFQNHKCKIDKSILHTDLRFEKVVAVEYLDTPQHVYDLTVDKYHTYIANCIISHNCNAKIIQIGTPKTRNHFYDACEGKEKDNWVVVKKPWYECEQLWAMEATYLPDHLDPTHTRLRPYSTFVLGLMPKALKQEYFPNRPDLWTEGSMSIEDFKTQYILDFVDGASNYFTSEEIAQLTSGEFGWEEYGSYDGIYFAGIDFAGGGEDFTHISVIKFDPASGEKRKVFAYEMKDITYPEQIHIILKMFGGERPRFNCRAILADQTGCGRPVIEMLQNQGLTNLEGIVFNATSPQGMNYKNFLFKLLKLEIDYGRFKYPSKENMLKTASKEQISFYFRMVSELSDLEITYRENSVNNIIAGPSGGHDDVCSGDALSIGCQILYNQQRKMPKATVARLSR